MRHMASHDMQVESSVRVKGEVVEENYVVVEVIQGAEEQYEDEATDLELEDDLGEEMHDIVEENDNYTLSESENPVLTVTDLIINLTTLQILIPTSLCR